MSARAVLALPKHLSRQALSFEPLRPTQSQLISPISCVFTTQIRYQSVTPLPKLNEQPIPVPPATAVQKDYPKKIVGLVDEISKLTLIEVADLSELLKKNLRIPDQAFMGSFGGGGAGPAAGAAAQEEETTKKKEKTVFTIRLVKFDETKKVPLIKEVKGLVDGLNLVQAKKYVETLPQVVRLEVPKEEAEKVKAQLEAAGGVVEMV